MRYCAYKLRAKKQIGYSMTDFCSRFTTTFSVEIPRDRCSIADSRFICESRVSPRDLYNISELSSVISWRKIILWERSWREYICAAVTITIIGVRSYKKPSVVWEVVKRYSHYKVSIFCRLTLTPGCRYHSCDAITARFVPIHIMGYAVAVFSHFLSHLQMTLFL